MANSDGFSLFGFQIKKKVEQNWSVVPPVSDDGSTVGNTNSSYYGLALDLEGSVKNENDLIRRYREVSSYSDCDSAIEDIVSEAIVADSNKGVISIELEDLQAYDKLKDIIRNEFDAILKLFDFEEKCHDIFRQWYVDGRLFYNVILDPNPKNGILELRYIDPRKIRKIKLVNKQRDPKTGFDIISNVDEYYLFNDKGITESSVSGIKMSIDSVIYGHSGVIDYNTGMVLSYLQKAVKPTNQLKVMEDALVIYRISRSAERRVFYIDVGNLPKLKAEQYVQEQMNRYRNKVVYDACLDMNTKVPLLDGRVLTLHEMQSEFEQGKEMWVYSCNPETGEFAPGLVTSAGVTRFNEKVIRLTLDNGEIITCTCDHKFPVWNKGNVEAKDLVVGDSMVPLYRRDRKVIDSSNSYYEQIFDNNKRKWLFTHREVSKWKDSKNLDNEMIFNEENSELNKRTVHHKNYNRRDNSPNNLVKMSRKDHFDYHKQHNGAAGKIGGSVTAEKRRSLGIPFFNEDPIKKSERCRKQGELIGKRMKEDRKGVHGLTPEETLLNSQLGSKILQEKLQNDIEFRNMFCESQRNSWTDERRAIVAERSKNKPSEHFIKMNKLANEARWSGENSQANREKLSKKMRLEFSDSFICTIQDIAKGQHTIKDVLNIINESQEYQDWYTLNSNKPSFKIRCSTTFNKRDLQKACRYAGFSSWTALKEAVHYKNHKIVKIDYPDEYMDVGTLGIDKDEIYHDYHTFALESGIYTCNSTGTVKDNRQHLSMIEDFWLARRSGSGSGTEITTLQSGSTLGQIEDINYFQNKLYQSLSVPISRLQPQQGFSLGHSTEITREEIKFNKFIERLRRKFASIFRDALRIQLITKGIINPDEWDDIAPLIKFDYQTDNHFAELKNSEIMAQRMNMLQQVDPYIGKYFSIQWVRKNVLMQTDEDLEMMNAEMEQEQEIYAQQQQAELDQQQQSPTNGETKQ